MGILMNITGKNFLITGGTGFLGKNIVPYILNRGGNVRAVGSRFDLSTENGTWRLFADASTDIQFDYIIHGAAVQAAGDWPLKHKAEQYDLNLRIHSNVLKAWKEYQPQARMIGIGSSCSYPGIKTVLKEDEYWDGKMHDSVDIYGFTKKAVSVGIEAYKAQYGLKGTTVVFATLYGPHDHFDPEKSHVVSALIKKFVDAKITGERTVEVWGDGTATRELIYVEDQIAGMLLVSDYDGSLINIGTGVETKISDLAELIQRVVGYEGRIVYNTNRFVGIKQKVLDVSLARNNYGWTTTTPLIDMEKGIRKTVDYYESTTNMPQGKTL